MAELFSNYIKSELDAYLMRKKAVIFLSSEIYINFKNLCINVYNSLYCKQL